MAIYHLEAKMVSRGAGRSAVAAAAYMSCSEIYNDYDGIQHDYTRKQGLVWQQTFLPPMAPTAWQDRAALWNAVEEAEKTKDSRLAREFVLALPVELNKEQQIALLTEFIQDNFVADGMCADAAIHDTDGHNPHAHILLTVRPLNEDGTWQYKTEKEYLCVKNGEERGFTSLELKSGQADGWEKQYPYKVGKKKVHMPPSEAELHGYERLSKYPKSTKFGRQNPISERWNSEEQLVAWRAAWADVSNRYLERAGSDERIDHRSHAARGLDEQPTIHEGVIAHALESKGIVSDLCELNRQIKADNKLLRELKAQVQKLMAAVKNTVPAIAELMENIRRNMLIFSYQLLHTRTSKHKLSDALRAVKPEFSRYTDIVKLLKAKTKELRGLLAEKRVVPVLNVPRHMELSRQITVLTEDVEELKNEKSILLNHFDKADDAGMKEIGQQVDTMEASLQKLEQSETRFKSELNAALIQYCELTERSTDMDAAELSVVRAELRPLKTNDAADRIKAAYGTHYNYKLMQQANTDVAAMLGEAAPIQEKSSIKAMLRTARTEQARYSTREKDCKQER